MEFELPEWHTDARCFKGPVSRWFASAGDENRMQDVKQALQACKVCPVADKCLQHAMEKKIRYGIWGGTTAAARCRIFDGGYDAP